MTVHEKFVEDMNGAGIHTEAYLGRFFWEGPAARSDEKNGPTLLDIIAETKVPLQWDRVDLNYVVYPVGQADNEEVEVDGYNDGYATRTPKEEDEEED